MKASKLFGWKKPRFDVNQYGKITIDNADEISRRMVDDFERGSYLEVLNCTLHTSWPFVQPPRYKYYCCDSKTVAGLYGALVVMALQAMVFEAMRLGSWQTYALIILGIPYAYLYRRQMKLHVAKRFRERILAQVPTT